MLFRKVPAFPSPNLRTRRRHYHSSNYIKSHTFNDKPQFIIRTKLLLAFKMRFMKTNCLLEVRIKINTVCSHQTR